MPAPDPASDLYGLPLGQFTPARSELVKRLRSEGNREEASRVGKLRKPTLPAWAVNQLVRTQPKRIGALFEAGDALAKAQAAGQADRLRDAAAEQRAELAGLMARAEGLLDTEGRGLTASVLERVSETLRAAAIDPDSRAQVAGGCLTRELRLTGLGGFGASAPSPARAKRGARAETDERRRQEVKAAREEERQAKRELKQSQAELRRAEKHLAAAQRARDEAAARVEQAQGALAAAGRRRESAQRGGR